MSEIINLSFKDEQIESICAVTQQPINITNRKNSILTSSPTAGYRGIWHHILHTHWFCIDKCGNHFDPV